MIINNKQGYKNTMLGFMLIELVVVLIIMTTLFLISTSSFIPSQKLNQLEKTANQLVDEIKLLSSLAKSQNYRIRMCGGITNSACSNSSLAWTNHWLIFSDIDELGNASAIDTNQIKAITLNSDSYQDLSITPQDALLESIDFLVHGNIELNGTTSNETSFLICNHTSNGFGIEVQISRTGFVQKVDSYTCPV